MTNESGMTRGDRQERHRLIQLRARQRLFARIIEGKPSADTTP